jgi:hypothetical protein
VFPTSKLQELLLISNEIVFEGSVEVVSNKTVLGLYSVILLKKKVIERVFDPTAIPFKLLLKLTISDGLRVL